MIDLATIEKIRCELIRWYQQNGRDFPWRKAHDPFNILIAELLLHQTFARKVVPVYLNIISTYPTPEALSRATVKDVQNIIRPLGFLYRAELMIAMSNTLVKDFKGVVPNDEKKLLSLQGVGTYTANAVLCFGFGHNVPIIDTNVLRIYRRLFSTSFHSTKLGPDKQSVNIANAILPIDRARDYNLALLDFAALVCTHYNPKCITCPLLSLCDYGKLTTGKGSIDA